METKKVASIIESILFITSGLISTSNISKIINEEDKIVNNKQIEEAIRLLELKYNDEASGLSIIRVEDSLQLISKVENNEFIERILIRRKKKTLSQAALEVISIIAYKQPVTKLEIDEIRGVKSDSVINTLLDLSLIEEKGKLDRIGKPILYGTTKKFLMDFGLRDIEDLPGKPREVSIGD